MEPKTYVYSKSDREQNPPAANAAQTLHSASKSERERQPPMEAKSASKFEREQNPGGSEYHVILERDAPPCMTTSGPRHVMRA
ncbi:hypothetical protein ACEPAI_9659 [Sanghuangporus weigelae]